MFRLDMSTWTQARVGNAAETADKFRPTRQVAFHGDQGCILIQARDLAVLDDNPGIDHAGDHVGRPRVIGD